MISMQERYRGTMLGLACGDALGGPVEFMKRKEIVEKFPDGLRDFVGGGWLHLYPGEITDDTQLTLALAGALDESGVNGDLLSSNFLKWYDSGPKDIGNTTRAALHALKHGSPWREAGEKGVEGRPIGSGAANGGVMRCAPVALRFRNDPEQMVQASLETAMITHAEERAKWGTVVVNQALVHLLRGGDRAEIIDASLAGISNEELRRSVRAVPEMRSEDVRAGGFVIETIQAAFWSLLKSPSAEEAIITAVAFGQDADTTGAVIGALAGAHWGAQSLPTRWTEKVQYRDDLIGHADRLLSLAG